MKKRIVVCADGSWNRAARDPDRAVPTSVLRLTRASKPTTARAACSCTAPSGNAGSAGSARSRTRATAPENLVDFLEAPVGAWPRLVR